MAGKIYLVGAGPGDPGLLTRRGAELIESADAVLYDALVNPDILSLAPTHCERVFVGKRPGQQSIPQTEINRMLIERGLAGQRVVRLKGGDPYIYGRGGEEALICQAAGLDVEVVPGITSAIAVPGYSGIPVLQRGLAGSVIILHGRLRTSATLVPPKKTEEEPPPQEEPATDGDAEEKPSTGVVVRKGPHEKQERIRIRSDHHSGVVVVTSDTEAPHVEKRVSMDPAQRSERAKYKDDPTQELPPPDFKDVDTPALESAHDADSDVLEDVDWRAVCRAADTIVILMPMGSLEPIRDGLIEGGRPPSQPVSLTQWGTTNRQRTLISTIADFPDDVDRAGLGTPSTLVIGEVVNLAPRLNFFEEKPLFGWRVAVTRPPDRAKEAREQLQEAGAQVLLHPAVKPVALEGLSAELKALQDDIRTATHILFASPSSVRTFFNALRGAELDARVLRSHTQILAVGARTWHVLDDMGIQCRQVHVPFTPKGVRETFGKNLEHVHVILAESAHGRGDLGEGLERRGARVTQLPLYHSVPDKEGIEALRRALTARELDVVMFFTLSAIEAVAKEWGRDIASALLKNVLVASRGPELTARLKEFGVSVDIESPKPDVGDFLRELIRYRGINLK
ncbi:uroporphyrinogen-III C-methyltransferase [bacterium]|nr:uroporphyrinogen-III C-methyltransferase [bacterium]